MVHFLEDREASDKKSISSKDLRNVLAVVALLIIGALSLWYGNSLNRTDTRQLFNEKEKIEILQALKENSSVTQLSIQEKREILDVLSNSDTNTLNEEEKFEIIRTIKSR